MNKPLLRIESLIGDEYPTPRFRAVIYDGKSTAKRPPVVWLAESTELKDCVRSAQRMFPDLILLDKDWTELKFGKTNIVPVIERNLAFHVIT